MKAKPSKGIVILGLLMVLLSAYHFFNQTQMGLLLENVKLSFQPLPEPLIIFWYALFVIMGIVRLIAGIGVVSLNDVFRKMTILYGTYNICSHLLEIPIVVRNTPALFIKTAKEMVLAAPHVSEVMCMNFIWKLCIIFTSLDIIFSIVLIVFFTRPKVIAQFQAKAGV